MDNIQQGTDEWFSARIGKVTASRVSDATAGGKGVSRERYMGELIAEHLSGIKTDHFKSDAMELGNVREEDARNLYSFRKNFEITEVGFVDHPTIEMAGASPDGLVGDDGLVEIKCPAIHTHIATVLDGKKIPIGYRKQKQWQMACTGRQWVDYVSYCPDLPEEMQLYIVRIERDNEMIAELESGIIDFQAELKTRIEELKKAKFA